MKITVFLADDHAIVRDGLQYLIDAQPDLQVIGVAADGRDAVRQTEQLRPDIIILDLDMPYLDGIEAAGQICRLRPATRSIILTIHCAPEHIARALQVGVRGYLLKESAGAELIEAIRAVYAGERYLSRDISDFVFDHRPGLPRLETESDLLATLTARERQVTQMVVEGHTTQEISVSLLLSPKTVKTYRSRVMRKLDVGNLPGLVKFAVRHGLTSLE